MSSSTHVQAYSEVLTGEHLDRDVPKYWPKLIQYAFLRDLGSTQAAAAEAVGRKARTCRRWENADPVLYEQARLSSRMLWRSKLDAAALQGLLQKMQEGKMGAIKFHLERTHPDYKPPEQAIEHRHEGRMLHGVVELPAQDRGEKSATLDEVYGRYQDHAESENGGERPRMIELPEQDEGEE